MTDPDIIKRIISGDNQVFKLLYKENFFKILSLVKKFSGSEQDAKDLFQDVIIDLLKNLKQGKFSNKSTIGTYMYSIAKNKLMNARRKSSKRSELKVDVAAEEAEDIDEHKSKDKKEQFLLSQLGQISEKCQQILRLFYFYKMSWKEIASEVGLEYGSIRVISTRCKNNLRTKLVTSPLFKQ